MLCNESVVYGLASHTSLSDSHVIHPSYFPFHVRPTSMSDCNGLVLPDLTQIILRSELLSQIRGSTVVLRDQIHKELGNLINLIRVIKLG